MHNEAHCILSMNHMVAGAKIWLQQTTLAQIREPGAEALLDENYVVLDDRGYSNDRNRCVSARKSLGKC